jgi:hypothetical protein
MLLQSSQRLQHHGHLHRLQFTAAGCELLQDTTQPVSRQHKALLPLKAPCHPLLPLLLLRTAFAPLLLLLLLLQVLPGNDSMQQTS